MHTPPMAIREPCWTCPALLDAERSFQLVLESPPVQAPAVVLRCEQEIVPVHVENRSPPTRNQVICLSPA